MFALAAWIPLILVTLLAGPAAALFLAVRLNGRR